MKLYYFTPLFLAYFLSYFCTLFFSIRIHHYFVPPIIIKKNHFFIKHRHNQNTEIFPKIYCAFFTCFCMLIIQDDYMEIYVSEKSREEFFSLLHHLLIKAGQRYISDVPHVEIIS